MEVMWVVLTVFAAGVTIFHLSELLITYFFNRDRLSFSSSLLSLPYAICMLLGLGEFFIEVFPLGNIGGVDWKAAMLPYSLVTGVCMMVVGEVMRKVGQCTATSNFTHQVATLTTRRQTHSLVTHGIYAFIRHPGYLGFFIWAVGTQVLLANPLCLSLFVAVLGRFFGRRIQNEERLLVEFFGDDYLIYKQHTPVYIPCLWV